MGFFSRLFKGEQRSTQLNTGSSSWLTGSTAGVTVTPDTALTIPAIYAAVRVIAETMASLPLPVYQRLTDGGKFRDRSHGAHALLNEESGPYATAFQTRESLIGCSVLHGNGYAEIERTNAGSPFAYHVLNPQKVMPKWIVEEGKDVLTYDLQLSGGKPRIIRAENMIHIAGLGFDGTKGYCPITLARQSIALGLAAETYGASFFEHNASPNGVLKTPNKLKDEARKNLRESVDRMHAGPANAGRFMLLEEGLSWESIALSNEDNQWIQSRQFSIQEFARLLRVPPHLIGDLSRSTNNNIEQQGLEFVAYCLRPWAVRIEKELNRKLFSKDERQVFFCEHLFDGLLRGDAASRSSALQTQFINGALNLDEWREIENRNPLPDKQGRIHFVPMNLTSIEKVVQGQSQLPQQEQNNLPTDELPVNEHLSLVPHRALSSPESRNLDKAKQAVIAVAENELGRLIRRECSALRRASRDPQRFLPWLDTFYEEHEALMRESIAPAMSAILSLADHTTDAQTRASELAASHVAESKRELLALAGAVFSDQLPAAVEDLTTRWESSRAKQEVERLA